MYERGGVGCQQQRGGCAGYGAGLDAEGEVSAVLAASAPGPTMQSAGLVLWLLAVCACHPDQAPPRPAPLRSTHQRPRANLLALVRAAAALHPRQSRLPAHAHYHVAQGAPPPSAPQDEEPLQPQETGLPEVPTWAKRSEATSSTLSGQQEVAGAVGASGSTAVGLPQGAAVASTFLRHARSGPRPYDVPRIGKYSNSTFSISSYLPSYLIFLSSPSPLTTHPKISN